jgi:hypothetical protein
MAKRGEPYIGPPREKHRIKNPSVLPFEQLDLILQLQLFLLQATKSKRIRTGMSNFLVNPVVETVVTGVEFSDTGFECHGHASLE